MKSVTVIKAICKKPTKSEINAFLRKNKKICSETTQKIEDSQHDLETLKSDLAELWNKTKSLEKEIRPDVESMLDEHLVESNSLKQVERCIAFSEAAAQVTRDAQIELNESRNAQYELSKVKVYELSRMPYFVNRKGKQTLQFETDEIEKRLRELDKENERLRLEKENLLDDISRFKAFLLWRSSFEKQIKKQADRILKVSNDISELIELRKARQAIEQSPNFNEEVHKFTKLEKRRMVKESAKAKQDAVLTSRQIKIDEKNIQLISQKIADLNERNLKRSLLAATNRVNQKKSAVTRVDGRISDWLIQKSKSNSPHLWLKDGRPSRFSAPGSEFAFLEWRKVFENLDLPRHATLHNLIRRRDECEYDLKQALSNLKKINSEYKELETFKQKKKEIERRLANAYRTVQSQSGKTGAPPRMTVENWDDAEKLAVEYMKWLGFGDAKKTGSGADEGKDVQSLRAVAQVKDMGTGVTRPMVQQLYGVASAEKKIPIFFARSYAKTAREWAEKNRIALFTFTLRGDVKAVSPRARVLVADIAIKS